LLSFIDHFHLHHSADLRGLRAGRSGDLLPPSPPAEKATARQDEAGKASTDDGTEEEFASDATMAVTNNAGPDCRARLEGFEARSRPS
jgi:hypothetical protein